MPDSVQQFLDHASFQGVSITNEIANTTIDELVEVVNNHQDCILFGPPGTSKTYMIDHLKEKLGDAIGMFKMVQFHSNYSYEEFIEGIVPDVDKGGFKYEKGVFFEFCVDAQSIDRNKLCVFVIDEINRANVTAVFGEVLNLMEDKESRKLLTAKTHTEFYIPSNVVIVGTMNTADKTLAKLDFAFRRRFRFLSVFPSKSELYKMIAAVGFAPEIGLSVDEYVTCFEVLNTKIIKHQLLGKNLTLGHVLWTRKSAMSAPYTVAEIGRIFKETIFPQVENYCGSNRDVLGTLLGTELRDKIIYGYVISDEDVINFLQGLKNSKVVES